VLAADPEVVVWALGPYRDALRTAVLAGKFDGQPAALTELGRRLGAALAAAGVGADLVTFVAAGRVAGPPRDHAERIAAGVATALDLPLVGLLAPAGGRDLGRARRVGRPDRAPPPRPPPKARHRLAGGRLLLVDDLATTGGTLAGAATTLRLAGARRVEAAVLAATPTALRPPEAQPLSAHPNRSPPTAPSLHRAHQAVLLDELGVAGRIDLRRVSVDSFSLRAVKGDLTGANPIDRGKQGSKLHLAGDASGLPLAVILSAANANDATMFEAVLDDIPPIRMPTGRRRRRPGKVHGDKAYDHRRCRAYLRRRGIRPRIARRMIESSERLGRHRWTIERTGAWLGGWRRLRIRYERCSERFYALAMLACSVICFHALQQPP
jgi:predicted amidophosphoribosyltransferase/transposase